MSTPQYPIPVLTSLESDTSVCSHLRELVERRRATPPAVKSEPGDAGRASTPNAPQPSALEKRYAEVVRWGALDQGIKRKKVSCECDGSRDISLRRLEP